MTSSDVTSRHIRLTRQTRQCSLSCAASDGKRPMEIGWYHEFHRQVPGQSDADAFAMGLEQARTAEEWGLDAIWLAEIHQQAGRSVMSVPMTVLATIAGQTSRLKQFGKAHACTTTTFLFLVLA